MPSWVIAALLSRCLNRSETPSTGSSSTGTPGQRSSLPVGLPGNIRKRSGLHQAAFAVAHVLFNHLELGVERMALITHAGDFHVTRPDLKHLRLSSQRHALIVFNHVTPNVKISRLFQKVGSAPKSSPPDQSPQVPSRIPASRPATGHQGRRRGFRPGIEDLDRRAE